MMGDTSKSAGGNSTPVDRDSPSYRHGDGEPILRVRDLEKYYPVTSGVFNRHVGDVKAVDGVNFDLYPGETLAIVGESGCGKSTLAETILSLESPTGGETYYRDQPLSELSGSEFRRMRRNIQMIFQDPFSSLNDRLTVAQIVREPLTIHDERSEDREAYVRQLLDDVGLDPDNYYSRFPHELSGGQRQRVSIARALALNPSIIVADEPVSALDVSIQAQILSLLEDLQNEYNLTYLFISHDLSVVRHVADRVAVMYLGRIVELADTETLFEAPEHPYTEALLSNIPRVDSDEASIEDRIELEGTPPDPSAPPEGCNFYPRCHLYESLDSQAQQRCETEDPIGWDGGDRATACHFRPTSESSALE